MVPAIFKIAYSVSPTPTLSPALFLIFKLPVVAPFASVGIKFSAALITPASSKSPLALVAVPL